MYLKIIEPYVFKMMLFENKIIMVPIHITFKINQTFAHIPQSTDKFPNKRIFASHNCKSKKYLKM